MGLFIVGDITKEDALTIWRTIETEYTHARFGFVRMGKVNWKLSGVEIVELAGLVRDIAQISWGFLADDDHTYGMFRMFTGWARVPEERFRVFRREAAAHSWLKTCGCESPSSVTHAVSLS